MGEYAEMMLDGTCCSQCGEFIDTDNGYPTLCAGCAAEDTEPAQPSWPVTPKPAARECPQCGKRLRTMAGVKQHIRDKHAAKP